MASSVRLRLWVLVAALLFSTGGTIVKSMELSAPQVACLRSAIAFLTLFVLMPQWRRFWHPRCLLVGIAYAVTMACFVFGNKFTTAANTIFLQSTAPLYVLIFGPTVLGEARRREDYLYVVLLALGMLMFLVGSEAPQASAPNPPLGNKIAAVAGLSWAVTLIGLRWLSRSYQPGHDLAGASVVAGNALVALALVVPAWPLTPSSQDLALGGFLGVFQIGLAYILLTRAARELPAIEISLLVLAEPVSGALWAWIVHNERPGLWSLAGGALIMAVTIWIAFRSESAASGEAS